MDARRAQEPLTAKRRALFLTELARHGVFARAARVASPHTATGACASFRELARRDAEFAAHIAEAREQADGDLLVELHHRAVEGVVEDVYGPKGEVVGQRRRMSDRLLTEKLRSRFPKEFASRAVVEQETTVRVKPLGLDQLSPESQEQLLAILERETGEETKPNGKRPTDSLPIQERHR